jgi:diaminopimelate epimerase
MNGSGNDFVVIDNRTTIIPRAEEARFTRAVCDRRRSIGADGVVFIQIPGDGNDALPVDFAWRYRNADGSEGEFCGNGAMCAARFATLSGLTGPRSTFLTPAGIVSATVVDAPGNPRVSIAIDDPSPVSEVASLTIAGQPVDVYAVTVGVPHAVTVVADIDEPFPRHGPGAGTLFDIGQAVRHHAHFAPAGTNLDAIQVRADGAVLMRTYERGVEDETLACGSGAVASALVAATLGLAHSPVTVITRGGSPLIVNFDWEPARWQATQVSLSGRAAVIAVGELTGEALE